MGRALGWGRGHHCIFGTRPICGLLSLSDPHFCTRETACHTCATLKGAVSRPTLWEEWTPGTAVPPYPWPLPQLLASLGWAGAAREGRTVGLEHVEPGGEAAVWGPATVALLSRQRSLSCPQVGQQVAKLSPRGQGSAGRGPSTGTEAF